MPHQVLAPMAGTIFRVDCVLGAVVEADTILLVMESMKMEVPIEAGMPGTVRKIRCLEGDIVDAEHLLVDLE